MMFARKLLLVDIIHRQYKNNSLEIEVLYYDTKFSLALIHMEYERNLQMWTYLSDHVRFIYLLIDFSCFVCSIIVVLCSFALC